MFEVIPSSLGHDPPRLSTVARSAAETSLASGGMAGHATDQCCAFPIRPARLARRAIIARPVMPLN
jgi:hypothetical protein